ncbi:restriction endonuclease subunit S [Yersinia ruckeri]|uniref:restriction endonuclease subunit S n=1 Tax=Yersinia ruckeri TaxID=29486 RepID=UPI002237482F|nr:restriction endonuclease subunit S [Yersinia ruckeri]EKN3347138.1 restriction endonuclease subunit S [Yersinia ruckeri]EKN4208396.1 restriction endonuclease subunit S [Yersinia ruckeri]MCW6672378.1 restriction endonuclease subunit S [Yersinia ruckeri]UZX64847.1 restriction endonuclease subunit S [Yersinia ruckeri]
MESNWPSVKLGDYCCKIGSGATPKGGSSVYQESGYICLIRSQNVHNEGFNESGLVYIDEAAATKLKNVVVERNDILLNITGDSVARVCLASETFLPARVNQHVAIIRPNTDDFDSRFLRYVLVSPKVQALLLNLSSAGATRNALTKKMIEDFEVSKPPLDVQIIIADMLESLDNKITLNRQINQTLDQMAQALFKSWFVDFDPVVDNALDAGFFEQDLEFSDELLRRAEARKAVRENADFKPLPEDIRQLFPAAFEECSEPSLGLGGWVPEGWVYDCFSELLSSTIGGDWGKDSQDEKHTIQSRIVRGTDIPDLISGQLSNAPLRWVDPKKLQSRQIEAGDIIIEVSGGSPTQSTGRSIFITQSMLNRLGGVVEPASFCRRFKPKSFCLGILASLHLQAIYSDGKMWEYQNQSTGIANFQTKFFLEAERVLMPSDKVLENFCQIVTPLIEKSQNSEQVALAKLRDTLLPKLISGELCIGDSEVDTAEEVLA